MSILREYTTVRFMTFECKVDYYVSLYIFFFQAEDGIRDLTVTGVQTCALPICRGAGLCPGREDARLGRLPRGHRLGRGDRQAAAETDRVRRPGDGPGLLARRQEIGRASCRERGESWVGGGGVK